MSSPRLAQPGKELKSVMLGPQHTSRRWRFHVEKKGSLDKDARAYIEKAGVKNAQGRQQISDYVRGLKALGWWGLVVSFPLRFHQNSESGGTIYALGRDFEGEEFSANIIGTVTRTSSGLVIPEAGNYLYMNRFAVSDISFWIGGCARVVDQGELFQQADSVFQINGYANGQVLMVVYPFDINNSVSDIPALLSFSSSLGFFQFTGNDDAFTSKKNAQASSGSTFTAIVTERCENSSIGNCEGTMPFFFFASAIGPDNSNQNKFYSLYKSTLGQGLGLP